MEGQEELRTNRLIMVVAALLCLAVAGIYVTPKFSMQGNAFDFLPALNASINATVSFLLVLGYWFIRTGKKNAHRIAMTTAIGLSALFLISYVTYHTTHESTSFGGEGFIRYLYFFVLLTHIVLAIVIVPLVLITFSRAWSGRFDKHRKIARITLPIWLYVSVTGVLVYFMISPYY